MRNKRGAELPMSTIIVVILVILVLVIVAAAFTGGMKTMFDKIKALFGVYSAADVEAARQLCDTWCSAKRQTTWCGYHFKGLEYGEIKDPTCTNLGLSCDEVTCPK